MLACKVTSNLQSSRECSFPLLFANYSYDFVNLIDCFVCVRLALLRVCSILQALIFCLFPIFSCHKRTLGEKMCLHVPRDYVKYLFWLGCIEDQTVVLAFDKMALFFFKLLNQSSGWGQKQTPAAFKPKADHLWLQLELIEMFKCWLALKRDQRAEAFISSSSINSVISHPASILLPFQSWVNSSRETNEKKKWVVDSKNAANQTKIVTSWKTNKKYENPKFLGVD